LENFPVYEYGVTEKPRIRILFTSSTRLSEATPSTNANVADEGQVAVPIHGEEIKATGSGEIEPLLSATLENPDRVYVFWIQVV
jgi:hypothetical protein